MNQTESIELQSGQIIKVQQISNHPPFDFRMFVILPNKNALEFGLTISEVKALMKSFVSLAGIKQND